MSRARRSRKMAQRLVGHMNCEIMQSMGSATAGPAAPTCLRPPTEAPRLALEAARRVKAKKANHPVKANRNAWAWIPPWASYTTILLSTTRHLVRLHGHPEDPDRDFQVILILFLTVTFLYITWRSNKL